MTTPTLGSRALFPDLQPAVYLNHAAISPPSLPVREAVRATLDGYASRGVSFFADTHAQRGRVRGLLAGLMNAAPDDVALIPNTSAGVVDIALCLPWRRGDRVLLFDGEFPTNVTPWQQAARRHDLELVWMRADDFRTDADAAFSAFSRHLQRGVRLVAVSAVQFSTGLRMPVAAMGALCREHGAELFVDAIQALGIVPLDVQAWHIDYLTAGGHKWLMAPEGTGALYVAPRCAAALRPEVAAWLSHDEPFTFLFEGAGHLRYDRPLVQTPRMVEGGAANVLGLAGMEASLTILHELGIAAIRDHVHAWHDAIEPGLLARGFTSARTTDPAGRSGILSTRPPDDNAPAWARALADHGVSCASPDGWLRMAPHWPNGPGEVATVLAAIDAIAASGGPGTPT